MNHVKLLEETARILKERTMEYGDPADTYERAAIMASTALAIPLTPYDIVMIMALVKLSRATTDPQKLDNYQDGINFMAFDAQMANARLSPTLQSIHGKLTKVAMQDKEERPLPPQPSVGFQVPEQKAPPEMAAVDLDQLEAALTNMAAETD